MRVASFAYEGPARRTARAGDIFMPCSDYPHSEGTAHPVDDYVRAGCDTTSHAALFSANADLLLGP